MVLFQTERANIIGGSFNGRTTDSDSVNRGSTPFPPAIEWKRVWLNVPGPYYYQDPHKIPPIISNRFEWLTSNPLDLLSDKLDLCHRLTLTIHYAPFEPRGIETGRCEAKKKNRDEKQPDAHDSPYAAAVSNLALHVSR